MRLKELLPTILMLLMLGSAGGYVYLFGDAGRVFWSGFFAMLVFYALIFFMGSYVATRQKNKAQGSDTMLAGRAIPLWISVFTMCATWLGGGYINGSAEATYKSGLMWLQAPWGYALSLILGGIFFARIMRKYKFRTMLDPLEQKFGKRTTAVLFIPALVGELFWTAAILSALGSTFSIVIGLDPYVSVILSAVVAISYTALGGLWAVALTDVIQLALLFIGLFIVVPFILASVGGWDAAWGIYSAKMGGLTSFLPDQKVLGSYYWNWWDFAFLLVLGGIPWQSYFQRVLAARSDRTAVNLSIISGIVCLLAAIPSIIIGVVGYATDWTAYGGAPANSLDILPYAIKYLTPTLVATIGLGAVAAAVMSSVDSSILSAASMSVWNVYRPLFQPNLEERKLGKLVQINVWIIGIIATIIALSVGSIYVLWALCADFVYCLLFPALVCALFDKKSNKYGAIFGFSIALLLRFGGGEPAFGIPALLPYPIIDASAEIKDGWRVLVLFPYRTAAMLAGLLGIIIVSRLTQHWEKGKTLQVVELAEPQNNVA
jgi:high affinity choline transporter 7